MSGTTVLEKITLVSGNWQGLFLKRNLLIGPGIHKNWILYINEEWMIELLVGSQQPLAKELAEYMGIKIIGHKYIHKEAGGIYTIQKVFEGIAMKRQFSIGSYGIDLYFPEHKLAIECKEYDHKDRDINYEIR